MSTPTDKEIDVMLQLIDDCKRSDGKPVLTLEQIIAIGAENNIIRRYTVPIWSDALKNRRETVTK